MSSDVEAARSGNGVSLRELQTAIRADGVSHVTISPAQLDTLARKLERVRSWGGAYAAIEFSPEIMALLNQRKTIGGGIVELPAETCAAGRSSRVDAAAGV